MGPHRRITTIQKIVIMYIHYHIIDWNPGASTKASSNFPSGGSTVQTQAKKSKKISQNKILIGLNKK